MRNPAPRQMASRLVAHSGLMWILPLAALMVLLMPLAARAQSPSSMDAAANPVALLIEQALDAREPGARHAVTFTGAAPSASAELVSLDYQPRTGAFSAMIAAEGAAQPVRVTGRAEAMTDVPALGRGLASGDVISASDIVWIETPLNRLPADALLDPAELEGQEAKRSLRAGVILRRFDVKIPSVILKDELIDVIYRRPGITLTVRGRATQDAAAGEPVRIMNLQSNRMIEATAEGPGRASVASPRDYADASLGRNQ